MRRGLLAVIGRYLALTGLLAGAILGISHGLGRPVDVIGVVGIAGAIVFGAWLFLILDERLPGTGDHLPRDLEVEPARAFRSFQVLRTQIRGSLSSSDHRADPLLSDLGEIACDRVRRYWSAGEPRHPSESQRRLGPDVVELLTGSQLGGELTLERLEQLVSDLQSIDGGGRDDS